LLAAVTKALRAPGSVFTPWDYADQIAETAKLEAEMAETEPAEAHAVKGPDEPSC